MRVARLVLILRVVLWSEVDVSYECLKMTQSIVKRANNLSTRPFPYMFAM